MLRPKLGRQTYLQGRMLFQINFLNGPVHISNSSRYICIQGTFLEYLLSEKGLSHVKIKARVLKLGMRFSKARLLTPNMLIAELF